ncbi:TfoX/Sxy family protein [Alcanivorax sp. S6407]|uniref:TfoX/Sxy family protein n=1 Tax=Alcanivorax sp. S6407 TaxID=2926424 RepID=UPI001FF1CE25|nr:TfoX/Sxy family protein [Alcanivorax sp. S6407]
MAFDSDLAERVREGLVAISGALPDEKKMFGGLCFMIAGNMCCGILGDRLLARVGPDAYEQWLREPGASEMDFTGRAMKGMIMVDSAVLAEEDEMTRWLACCFDFVRTLPAK